jgi:competence protein ComEC
VDVRPVLWAVTGGVLAGQLLAAPWTWTGAGALALAVHRRTRLAALLLAAMAVGALRRHDVAPPADLRLPLRGVIEGRVVAAPQRRAGRTILVVDAPGIGLVRLSVRSGLPKVRYGDVVAAPTTLRRPRNFENPGRFDLVGHLARRGITLVGSVWQPAQLVRRSRPTIGLRTRIERWRARIARTIARTVPSDEGAVLTALVVGDDDGVGDSLRTAFTRAGVVHVLSVSGLHVGLVAVAAFGLARWLLGRSRRLLLAVDVARLAGAASVVPVAIYCALAGLEIATLRSGAMVTAAVLALLLGRRADVLRTLAVAALVLSLVWPGAPREIAFQLSFASVLSIVVGTRRLASGVEGGWRQTVRAGAVVSPVAMLGTAPLTAFWFQQLSPMSLVANPLAIPLFGSVVVVLGLMGACVEPWSTTSAEWLFRIAGLSLRPGLRMVRWLGSVGWAAVDVPSPTLVELALLYGVLAAAVWWPRRGAAVALALLVAASAVDVAWWARARFASGVLRLTVLDVGQGDGSVVELPDGRVLVVDAGGFAGSDFDTGSAIVSPFLATRKIATIDALVMTHAHPDHSGGLASLLWRRPRELWWNGEPGAGLEWFRLAGAMAASGVPIRTLGAGDTVGDGVTVVHPPHGWPSPSLNDGSLVLRVRHGDVAFLLTGDAEAAAEAQMLSGGAALDAVAVKVPHHGSRTSSGPRFVAAVSPRIAVISVGADNRYRLPNADVGTRYRARGVCVLRTDRCGAVTLETDGRALRVWSMRPGCACPD